MTDDINSAVDRYANAVKASVDVYARLAKNAGARLTNTAPPKATSWMDDAVTFWGTAAQDIVNLVATQQTFAAEAAKKAAPAAKKAAPAAKKAAPRAKKAAPRAKKAANR